MSLTKVSYSMITGAAFNILDFGADPTGAADSTSAIQAAINAAGAIGGGMVEIPSGTFQLTSVILNQDNIQIVGRGSSSKLLQSAAVTAAHEPTIWVARNNCAVSNVYFSYTTWDDTNYASYLAPNPGGNSYFGCHIAVTRTELYTALNSGVYAVYRGVTLQVVYNLLIENNTFHGSALHGVAIFNCFNATVQNNLFEQIHATGTIGFNTPNILIQNNKYISTADDAVYVAQNTYSTNGAFTPITSDQCTNVQILGNYSEKSNAKCWASGGMFEVVIANNVSRWNRSYCVSLESDNLVPTSAPSKCVVANNVMRDVFGGYGSTSAGFKSTTDIATALGGGVYSAINCPDADNVVVNGNHVTIYNTLPVGVQKSYRPFFFQTGYDINVVNNIFASMTGGPAMVGDVVSGTFCSDVVISNNQFLNKTDLTAGGVTLIIQRGANNVIVKNNLFLQPDQPYTNASGFEIIDLWECQFVFLTNNIFSNAQGYNTIRQIASVTNLYVTDNMVTYDFINRANTYAISNLIEYGSAAPTTGSYAQGSVVFNSTATSGQPAGWMCTVGGTPGTWKAMANLA